MPFLNKHNMKITSKQFYNLTAWKYFSRYMKLKYSVYSNGYLGVQCCTSGKWFDLEDPVQRKQIHLGHFIKVFNGNSTNFATAFHEMNVAPQCYQDNSKRGGMQLKMMDWLINKHGKESIDNVRYISNKPHKLHKFQLDFIAKEYKKKYNNLLNTIGVKDPFK